MNRIATPSPPGGAGLGVLLLGASVAASQASFAALPAVACGAARQPDDARRASRSGASCSGIRSSRATATWRAAPATIRGSATPRTATSRSASTASASAIAAASRQGSPVPFVKRNSQTILNVAFNGIDEAGRHAPGHGADVLGCPRRSASKQQALEPLKTLEEMRGSAFAEDKAVDAVVARLAAVPEYRKLFADAFGAGQGVTSSQPCPRAGGLPAVADRQSLAVRPLHARRHRRDGRVGAARHAAVRADRLRQLPHGPDVLRLQAARARRPGQPEAAGVGRRR